MPTSDPNSRRVQAVLFWILVANLAVVAAKAVAGWLADSLSVMSDAGHSLTDSINNVAGIFLIRLAMRPADWNHPYGHAKIEQIGSFGITGMMLLTAYEIGREAVLGLRDDPNRNIDITALTFGVMIGTFLVNIAVVWYERRAGQRLQSVFLMADAQHTMSDIYVTLGVLAGLVFVKLGWFWVDRVVALIVVCAIVRGAFQVVREAGAELMDSVAVKSEELESLAAGLPDVIAVRDIRSRGRGVYGFAELTLVFAHNDLRRAHETSEALEDLIRERYNLANITIHLEPSLDPLSSEKQ